MYKNKVVMQENKYLLILLIALIVSCENKKIDIERGLLVHYTFNGNAKNVVSGSTDITFVNDIGFTQDKFKKENSACYFNGVSSMIWVNLKDFPTYGSPKTISWWYFQEGTPNYKYDKNAENMIVLVDTLQGKGIQFGLRAPVYQTKGFDIWLWGGGTLLETNIPEIKNWHHCVYSYDGSMQRFYIDGEEVANSNFSLQDSWPKQLMFGNYPSGNQFFKGKLDEVRIYNRVLDIDEIRTLYNLEF